MIYGYYEGQEVGRYAVAFGDNDAVGGTAETIWASGATYTYPAAAAASTIESSSANDDGSPVGTGARTARIRGVGTAANGYPELEETVTLNGTGAVTLAYQYLRINSVEVLTYGATGGNVGTLTAKIGSTVVATVRPTENKSSQAVYTVPKPTSVGADNNTCLLASMLVAVAPTFTATVELWIAEPGAALAMRERYVVANQLAVKYAPAYLLAPGTDIEIRGKMAASSGLISGTLGIVWV